MSHPCRIALLRVLWCAPLRAGAGEVRGQAEGDAQTGTVSRLVGVVY